MQRLGHGEEVSAIRNPEMVSKRHSRPRAKSGRRPQTVKPASTCWIADDVMNKQREDHLRFPAPTQLMEEPDQREYLVGDTGGPRATCSPTPPSSNSNPNLSEDEWDIENTR